MDSKLLVTFNKELDAKAKPFLFDLGVLVKTLHAEHNSNIVAGDLSCLYMLYDDLNDMLDGVNYTELMEVVGRCDKLIMNHKLSGCKKHAPQLYDITDADTQAVYNSVMTNEDAITYIVIALQNMNKQGLFSSDDCTPEALAWCRDNAPSAIRDLPDAELWDYMKDSYKSLH